MIITMLLKSTQSKGQIRLQTLNKTNVAAILGKTAIEAAIAYGAPSKYLAYKMNRKNSQFKPHTY
jgi:hypothetical protein